MDHGRVVNMDIIAPMGPVGWNHRREDAMLEEVIEGCGAEADSDPFPSSSRPVACEGGGRKCENQNSNQSDQDPSFHRDISSFLLFLDFSRFFIVPDMR
jgi:hypothetical protein